MARNVRVRRLVAEILYSEGAMTKTKMFSYLANNHKLLKEPTEHSLSSIMNKNSQVIRVGTEIAVTESGNKTTHILFDVNRDIIKTYDDLVMTMPFTLLTKKESEGACRCPKCARVRIPSSGQVCLECDLYG